MFGVRGTTLRAAACCAPIAAISARGPPRLYFRYGSAASTAFRGVQILNTLNGLRTGLSLHAALPSLTTLATNKASEYARQQSARICARTHRTYGILARAREATVSRPPCDSAASAAPRPRLRAVRRTWRIVCLIVLIRRMQLERLSRFCSDGTRCSVVGSQRRETRQRCM